VKAYAADENNGGFPLQKKLKIFFDLSFTIVDKAHF